MSGKAGLERNTAFRMAAEWDAHIVLAQKLALMSILDLVWTCCQLSPVSTRDLEVADLSI